MAVRVRYAVAAAISSTTAEERDLGNTKWEIVNDTKTKGGTWKSTLLAGAVQVQLQLDNVSTIQLLVIRTNAKDPNQIPNGITIQRNNTSAEPILIQPLAAVTCAEGTLVLSTDSLTSIYASNPGTVDMEITVIVAGV